MSTARRDDLLTRLNECTDDELGVALAVIAEVRVLCRYGGHGEATLVFKHGELIELHHKHTRRIKVR